MLTLLVVCATLLSYGYSVPLNDRHTRGNHMRSHKRSNNRIDTLALKEANVASVLQFVRRSMCSEHERKQCSAKCCSKRCKTEGSDERLVSCADLHRMIVALKERMAAREKLKTAEVALSANAEKSDTVNDKKENSSEKSCPCNENGGAQFCDCGEQSFDGYSFDCPPTAFDTDCGADCKNDTRGDFDNCGDDCECCDDNDCDCTADAPEDIDDNQYKNWKCTHDESECGQENMANGPIEVSLCNQKSAIDKHEHHHYHHHSPCCIAVNHRHVNIHHHDHQHEHCHCIGCPCRYNNYKCTPIKPNEGGGVGDCCGGVQRDATANLTMDATNNNTGTADNSTLSNNTANVNGGVPSDNANNLLRCTSLSHMIDELKGEINTQASAQANGTTADDTEDKTGDAKCIIYKAKDHGMWACNDESFHHHKRHKIKRFYGDGKNKKHMHSVRKALRHFLTSWLHPANQTKSSIH